LYGRRKPDTGAATKPVELPRLKLVFSLRQCDKENQGSVKALFAKLSAKIRSANLNLHPPVKLASNEKRISLSHVQGRSLN
jgi:hypothetical protein